jgi:DNA/RNA-binding domain of Phe-tRNA-synthetase-like protein
MVWDNKLIINDIICDLLGEVWIGLGLAKNVTVSISSIEQINMLRSVESDVRSKFSLMEITKHPVVRAYRDFYWRIGIDPTKQRPSSEALLRRVLQNKSIPSINNIVDAGNIASLTTLIPIGLYDADIVEGSIVFRLSIKNERFVPIGGREEFLNKGQPILADDKRIIHLYPHRDSSETMITQNTKNVIVFSLGVPGINLGLINESLEMTLRLIIKYAGGSVSEKRIIKIC